MEKLTQQFLTGERALFQAKDMEIHYSTFADGESPLKESRNVHLYDSLFQWKYPLWYSRDIRLDHCTLFEGARAGIWYTHNIEISNTLIAAPKSFRRATGIRLEHVHFPHAAETMWNCDNIEMHDVTVNGDYFAMGSSNIRVDGMALTGGYAFDGCRNVEVRNARLITKDAFWNCENVTVYDSLISGEYLGWNAKNVTFVNCVIESLQGMCYMEGVTMRNCRLLNTTLAFEYSTVDAEIDGTIDSVMNPTSGRIVADQVKELILDETKIDPAQTTITIREGNHV